MLVTMFKIILVVIFCSAVRIACGEESSGPQQISTTAKYHDGNNCECSVFNTSEPCPDHTAIMIESVLQVECNEEGKATCTDMCKALALAAHDKSPKILCSHLGDYNNLEVFLHSRICGSEWQYTGLNRGNLCCKKSEVVECVHEN
ncbi:hypothetical protein PPYR_01917 [Photinus pyralis]|uniref:Uncharacterized protein n=1 Tax=Photinus pyralis TaxID=7054 RepID=A0A5N4B5Q0_PHOPY|nr:uncharacterized protein LOC116179356 [Photinus pyralis]KAB0804947.1 hypothetical protein PPYR_01917 [Photinus pyralis]